MDRQDVGHRCTVLTLSFCALLSGAAIYSRPAVADTATDTVLYSFSGPDGSDPYGHLVQGSDGNFYGTTYNDGVNGVGTIFKMTPSGTLTTLYSFTGGTDGGWPYSALVQASDGNFYGTTLIGGLFFSNCPSGCGTLFRITPDGALTTLHAFNGPGGEGINPYAGLTLGSDGNLYGTTFSGGTYNNGTVFVTTLDGAVMSLYNFTGWGDGGNPVAALTQASDGNFYGTTFTGGAAYNANIGGNGTVFRITPGGALTTLHIFYVDASQGAGPRGGLVQGSDGNLYGTLDGGASTANAGCNNGYGYPYAAPGCGSIYRIGLDGTFFVPYTFSFVDGAGPFSDLILGKDGNFYGTTNYGTGLGFGDVFRMAPGGTVTVLYSFAGAPDGATPYAGVIQGSDGNLYGATVGGGSSGHGAVYTVTIQVPAAPTGLSASPGSATANLQWASSATATSYNVYMGTISGKESATPVATGITGTSATIAGLKNGKTYYFEVRAVNLNGNSPVSNEASTTPVALPAKVSGLTATAGSTQVSLSWSAATHATSYNVYMGTVSGQLSVIAMAITSTQYTVTGLTNGTKYYFKVAGVDAAGVGPQSSQVSAKPH